MVSFLLIILHLFTFSPFPLVHVSIVAAARITASDITTGIASGITALILIATVVSSLCRTLQF